MAKKFASENPKAAAARDRKETTKKAETEKKTKAAEDAQWVDDDKLINRKLARKDEEEQKRAELLKRKEENRKLAEEEMNSIQGKSSTAPVSKKVTRAEIEKQRAREMLAKMQEEKLRKQEAQKLQEVTKIEDNINKLTIDEAAARTVDEAIEVLGVAAEEGDKHPEKRMKAAYLAFEERRLPELKEEHPTYRLSQLKQVLKKEWQKSPDNPLNIKLLAMSQ